MVDDLSALTTKKKEFEAEKDKTHRLHMVVKNDLKVLSQGQAEARTAHAVLEEQLTHKLDSKRVAYFEEMLRTLPTTE